MAAEIYEDSMELTVGLLEALTPSPGQDAHAAAFPYPRLAPVGKQEARSFRTVVLENPLLRAVFVPDLGGRLLRLVDRRTNTQVLGEASSLPLRDDPIRGARSPAGVQIALEAHDRIDSLGSSWMLVEPAHDDDQADSAVWFSQVTRHISYHARWSMPADRAELRLELRAFNRLLQPALYNGGLAIYAETSAGLAATRHGSVLHYPSVDAGLFVTQESLGPVSTWRTDDQVFVARFASGSTFQLAPRQLDTFRLALLPYSKMNRAPVLGAGACMLLAEDSVLIQAGVRLPGCKLVVRTAAGSIVEAAVDLLPEHLHQVPLDSLESPATEVALLSPSREVIVRAALHEQPADLPQSSILSSAEPYPAAVDDHDAVIIPELRHAAYIRLAARANADGNHRAAAELLEQALLSSGEDHLAWWAKSVSERLGGSASEESPDLLNAHYLAPLEPALRAEGFLSQSAAMGKDPSALLRPLADAPESLVEVACLLIEAGLLAEASRWLDEALRHIDLPMLRYLQAHALLTGTRMRTEAAQHVSLAAKLPMMPPFPWRAIEGLVLKDLRSAFPDDASLSQYADLAGA